MSFVFIRLSRWCRGERSKIRREESSRPSLLFQPSSSQRHLPKLRGSEFPRKLIIYPLSNICFKLISPSPSSPASHSVRSTRPPPNFPPPRSSLIDTLTSDPVGLRSCPTESTSSRSDRDVLLVRRVESSFGGIPERVPPCEKKSGGCEVTEVGFRRM